MGAEEFPEVAPWGKWDKAALQLLFALGIAFGIIVFAFGTIGLTIELATGERMVELPVQSPLPAEASTGSATLIDGAFETATVYVSGLSVSTSAILTASIVIFFLTQLLVVATFTYLAWRLLRREPFMPSLSRSFVAAGGVLLIGSLIGQVIAGIAGYRVAEELGADASSDSFWPMVMTFDGAPLGVGALLLLVAAAFEYAQKLTVETRGLV